MDTALLIARLVLAAVFAVAGFAKLMDRDGSRAGLEGFGVPAKLAKPGGILLPLAEIAVAILLLPVATAWYAGLAALLLLLAFVGGIAYNMSKGRAPDCHCFGQIHSEPAGWSTLIRNGVLAAVAVFLLVPGPGDSGYSIVGWIGDLSAAEVVLGIVAIVALIAVVIEGWLLVHLLGQNGRVLLRLDALDAIIAEGGAALPSNEAAAPAAPAAGLPVGAQAPAFRLEGLHGETMTLDALRSAGKQVLLIFSDPTCGPCNALLPDIGKWQRDLTSRLTVALVSRGTADANRAKVTEHGLSHVLLQKDREVSNSYKAHGTPTAVVVNADGTIGSPVSGGAEAIRTLVSKTTGSLPLNAAPAAAPRPAPSSGNGAAPRAAAASVGAAAPAVSLPDLEGKTVNLSDYRGKKSLLVFWNPGCGFCRRMVDDLKSWVANPPAGAPEIVLVSTGTPEANRDLGIPLTTLLDEGFNTGRAYGASGTPSAVLVDADGKIASEVAVGAPGVMALANGEPPKPASNGNAPAANIAKKGQAAPEVKLPDLDGNEFDLSTEKSKTMLLFWNPGCGFCRRMIDDIKAFEAEPPKNAPKLVIVSTGTVESNREQGLSSRILLDQGFNTGRSFGASGTPSAVLIDAKGKISSEVAVGAPAVLALAGVQKASV